MPLTLTVRLVADKAELVDGLRQAQRFVATATDRLKAADCCKTLAEQIQRIHDLLGATLGRLGAVGPGRASGDVGSDDPAGDAGSDVLRGDGLPGDLARALTTQTTALNEAAAATADYLGHVSLLPAAEQQAAAALHTSAEATRGQSRATAMLTETLALEEQAYGTVAAAAGALGGRAGELGEELGMVAAKSAEAAKTVAPLDGLFKQLAATLDSGFSRFGDALADEFVKGELSAKRFREVAKGVLGELKQSLETAFKGVAKGLLDTILDPLKGLLKDLATRVVVDPLKGVLGGIGVPGAGGGLGGLLDAGSSLLGLVTGEPGSLATAFATSSVGQALGLSAPAFGVFGAETGIAGAAAASGTALTGAGSALVAAAPYAAIAAIALPLLFSLFRKRSSGPAFGAVFDLADGALGQVNVGADNGGDPEAARRLAEIVRTVVNGQLSALGATLLPGAFRGQLGFANGRFATSVDIAALAPDTNARASALPGFERDLRTFGDNARAATADFIARSLLLALKEGKVAGLSEEIAGTLTLGLTNAARAIDASFSEADFATFARRLDFLRRFDERLASLGITFDAVTGAIVDAGAALTRQERAARAATGAIEEQAKVWAREAVDPIVRFVEDARALFRPLEPAPAEAGGAALEGARVFQTGEERSHEPGRAIAFLRDDAGRELFVASPEERARVGFGAAGDEGARTLLGDAAGTLYERSFENGETQVLRLVEAVAALDDTATRAFDDLTGGRDRIAAAEQAARRMVDDLIDQAIGIEGAPGLTAFETAFQTAKEKILALEDPLGDLNTLLAETGATTLDVTATIDDALDRLTEKTIKQLDRSLDAQLAGVDAGLFDAVTGVVESRRNLLSADRIAVAAGEASRLGDIDTLFTRQVQALVDRYAISADTLHLLTGAVGDLDPALVALLDTLELAPGRIEELARSVTDGLLPAIDRQIGEQESLKASHEGVAEAARKALLGSAVAGTGTLVPVDRLARVQGEFERLLGLARGGDGEAAREAIALSDDLRRLARQVHGAGDGFVAVTGLVDRGLADIADIADGQADIAERQLETLRQIRDRLAPPATGTAQADLVVRAVEAARAASGAGVLGEAQGATGLTRGEYRAIAETLAGRGFAWGTGDHAAFLAGDALREALLRVAVRAAGGTFHEGGVVPRRRAALPGLAHDEDLAIVRAGEEVLTRDDPRHVLNAGAGRPFAAVETRLEGSAAMLRAIGALVRAVREEGDATRRQIRDGDAGTHDRLSDVAEAQHRAQAMTEHAAADPARRVA